MHSADSPIDSRGRIQISGSIPDPTQNIAPVLFSGTLLWRPRRTPPIRRKEISSRWRAEGFVIPSRSGVGTLCINRSEGVTP